MRTLILFTLSFIFSLSSQAQHKQKFNKHISTQLNKSPLHKNQVKHLPQITATYEWGVSSWALSDSTYTTYNEKGQPTSHLYGWNAILTYTYDAAGLETGYTYLTRDDIQLPWDTVARVYKTYDQYKNQTSETEYQQIIGIGWYIPFASKSALTYNSSHQLIRNETEYYDSGLEDYVKAELEEYEYDNTGKLKVIISKRWDNFQNAYTNRTKTAEMLWHQWYETNTKASLLSSFNKYTWKDTTYLLYSHTTHTYDSFDNEIEMKENVLFDTTWETESGYRYTLAYNQDGALIEKATAFWNKMDSSWNNRNKYVYSNFLSYNGLKSVNHQDIHLTITPNPFSEKAEITIASTLNTLELVVFDITGKKLQSHRFVSNKCVVEKGDLATGMYFYVVTDNQQTVASGKLMIH